MTKYRLVRDIAPFKRGDEFTITHEHGITAYVPVGTRDVRVLLPPYLLDEIEVGCWSLEDGEGYCYISDAGDIRHTRFSSHAPCDRWRLAMGNCYKTDTEARTWLEWTLARQRLIESGAMFANSLSIDSDGYCIDDLYYVYLAGIQGKLVIEHYNPSKSRICEMVLVFKGKDSAKWSIEEHRDDWLTYLGVKGGDDDDDDERE